MVKEVKSHLRESDCISASNRIGGGSARARGLKPARQVTFQLDQKWFVKFQQLAADRKISMAQLAREAVTRVLRESEEGEQ